MPNGARELAGRLSIFRNRAFSSSSTTTRACRVSRWEARRARKARWTSRARLGGRLSSRLRPRLAGGGAAPELVIVVGDVEADGDDELMIVFVRWGGGKSWEEEESGMLYIDSLEAEVPGLFNKSELFSLPPARPPPPIQSSGANSASVVPARRASPTLQHGSAPPWLSVGARW